MAHGGRELVPNAPLREAFLRSSMTISDFARGMGYVHTVPHCQRARKLLGLEVDHGGRGRRRTARERIDYATALKACEVLGLDPVDVGL